MLSTTNLLESIYTSTKYLQRKPGNENFDFTAAILKFTTARHAMPLNLQQESHSTKAPHTCLNDSTDAPARSP